MAKFGWDGRELFNVETVGLENLGGVPANPPAGELKLYFRAGTLYKLDSAGVESPIDTTGAGEANTASNQNVGGVGVFKQKTGVDLEFYGINAASNKVSVVLDAANNEIDIDVNEANLSIDHGNLSGLADDDHTQYLLLAGRAGGQIANGGTAASENLELRSTSNATKGTILISDGSTITHNSKVKDEKIAQTTNATPLDITLFSLADDTVYSVKAVVLARRSDGGGQERAMFDLGALVYRASGGSATFEGSTKQFQKEASSSVEADFSVSGNDLRMTVEGLSSEDYEWTVNFEYIASQ